MFLPSDDNGEWLDLEDDELVGRLRRLEWPTVDPEFRQRCWEEFTRRAEREGLWDLRADGPPPKPLRETERHEFTRRPVPALGPSVLGARVASANSLSRPRAARPAFSIS